MKKVITVLALLGSLSLILSSLRLGHQITMLLLAGQVPYTNIIMSPNQMFIAIALIAGFSMSVLITPRLRALVGVKRHNTLRP